MRFGIVVRIPILDGIVVRIPILDGICCMVLIFFSK
jgi:hypothetical protein